MESLGIMAAVVVIGLVVAIGAASKVGGMELRMVIAAAFTREGLPWVAATILGIAACEWMVAQSGFLADGAALRDANDAVLELRELEQQRAGDREPGR